MQASKIKVGVVYAIHWAPDDKRLVRFQVSAVVTRRTGDSPHDHHSKIEGHIHDGDMPDGGADKKASFRQLGPDAILGPFNEYRELVERQTAEKAAAQAEKQRKDDLRAELARLFYAITELPVPNDMSHYGAPFRTNYSAVEIGDEAVEKLIPALRKLL